MPKFEQINDPNHPIAVLSRQLLTTLDGCEHSLALGALLSSYHAMLRKHPCCQESAIAALNFIIADIGARLAVDHGSNAVVVQTAVVNMTATLNRLQVVPVLAVEAVLSVLLTIVRSSPDVRSVAISGLRETACNLETGNPITAESVGMPATSFH